MNYIVELSVGWQPRLEPLYAKLLQYYPEGFSDGRFRRFWGKFPLEKRILDLLTLLERNGLSPWTRTSLPRPDNQYSIRVELAWEPSELQTFEFLELQTPIAHEYGCRKDDGLYRIQTSRWYRNADFSRSDGLTFVVPTRVRQLFESSGLRGFRFAPTAIEDDNDRPIIELSWSEIGEPWWEMIPEHTLPPMAPWMPVVDVKFNRVGPDFEGGITFPPALMSSPIHYRRSDLTLPPEFDLYGTHERFYRPEEKERAQIVSQRFYRFCVENNLKCGFQPVRLDPDSGPTESIPPYPPELREFLTPQN